MTNSNELNRPHQRIGSLSNADVGADFERKASEYFARQGIALTKNFSIDLGLSTKKKHCFDLGSDLPKILVECKSHKWTAGAKVPSAKMTVWNEAMYYFHLAPAEYEKVFFVLHHRRNGSGASLLEHYKKTYAHLIPREVQFIEWDEETNDVRKI